jgi:phage gp29-like protein
MRFNPLSAVSGLFAAKKTKAVGAAGSQIYSDYALDRMFEALSRVPDPDAMLKKAGILRHKLRVMEYDDEISAALETRREAAISTAWRLTGDKTDQTDFIAAEMKPLADGLMRGIWNAVPYGFSVCEVVYAKRDNGRIGILKAEEKPMEWFEPKSDGTLLYRPPDGGLESYVDTEIKFIVSQRNPSYLNPYGEALLSRLYWPWQFRLDSWKWWMQFLERFGDPLMIGKSPDPERMVEELHKLGVRSVLAVGTNDSLDVIAQAGSGEFQMVEDALNRRIQKLILGQTLTSDVGSAGSYAAAKVHNEVRDDKRRADVKIIQTGLQRIVNALWALNNFGIDNVPRFDMGDEAGIERERADRDAILVNSGAIQLTEEYVLRAYDYQPGDITIPAPPPKTVATPPKNASAAATLELSERVTFGQKAIDDLGDEALAMAPEAAIPLAKLRSAILGAKDYKDLERRLSILMSKQDPDFEKVLMQAAFAAQVVGYVHADEGIS